MNSEERRQGSRRGVGERRTEARLEIPVWSGEALAALTPDFTHLPYAEAVARQGVLLRDSGGRAWLVAARETARERAAELLPWADACLGQPFSLAFAPADEIAALLAAHGGRVKAMDHFAGSAPAGEGGSTEAGGEIGAEVGVEVLRLETIQTAESPIVRLTNSTLYDAYKAGASDIHLEATAEGLRVRYRLDGVLTTIAEPRGVQTAEQVISRIKVMAELDIAERRIPQDGRFKVAVDGRGIDFRVSIMPSLFGEDAVLRLLDKQALTDQLAGLDLERLGYSGDLLRTVRRLAREPYGMLLVTGPTGSGKTTTLYAMLGEVNRDQDKIVTIEDPVEYQLPGVLQIPVNERKGLTFARGLRSILRHDPDKIMVGEIRDPETAQIAIQSALTGHVVFSTVHANTALETLGRFLHMGVPAQSFVTAINGILAQRLVRTNCPACSVAVSPDPAALADSGIDPLLAGDFDFRQGQGCPACRGSGYRGRRAIAEVLQLDDTLRELILAGAPLGRLREAGERGGMRPLREAALDLVRAGETTLAEINRVTFVA